MFLLLIALMITGGPAVAASAKRGKVVFDKLCSHCHNRDDQESKVGIAGLGDVTSRRDEAWLNQWLKNPAEFSKRDDVAKAISKIYRYDMTMPTLTTMQKNETRADVIEYLKTLGTGSKGK